MTREFFISSYLFVVKLLFTIFSRHKLQNKTVLIASFGDNINYVRKACLEQTDDSLVILTTSAARLKFTPSDRETDLMFEFYHPVQFIKSIYHIATAKTIFVDNYFGFLAVTTFKPEVRVIQLWHAAGAIKQFGLLDPTIKKRSKRAHNRFKSVYRRFTDVVVGSEKMVKIFKLTFDLSERQILRTGIPRTDFFFDETKKKLAKNKIYQLYPSLKEKKVILYAPTFRDQEIANFNLKLDLELLQAGLGKDYIVLLRLHPVVRSKSNHTTNDFVIDVSDYPNLNELLIVSDYLISDYSSIPFEYALLNRPMIFFSYDLECYTKERGFFEDYREQMPGPVVQSTEEIVDVIKSNTFDLQRIKVFSDVWNTFSDGHSTDKLINNVYHSNQR
jgi:CDP-glycerol glycerophosphotransferase (TagB/SpsB family)